MTLYSSHIVNVNNLTYFGYHKKNTMKDITHLMKLDEVNCDNERKSLGTINVKH